MTIDLFDRDLISKLPENDRESEIDPYLPEEREAILKGFRDHRPPTTVLCFISSGPVADRAKPARCAARTSTSTTAGSESKKAESLAMRAEQRPGPSNRQIRLHENLIEVLKDHVRFMLDPDAYLFTTPERDADR